jgi:nucleotide-binding universal stress UspA family protein
VTRPSAAPPIEVICAVDFSPASVAAAHAALGFIEGGAGRLTLVHVMPPWPRGLVFAGGQALRYLHEYEARAAAVAGRLMEILPDPERGDSTVEPLVVSGVPHQMILRAAREAKADLVVLGHSAPGEPAAGSTAHAVLRRAACPVLLVRGPAASGESRPGASGRSRDARPKQSEVRSGSEAVVG